MDNLVSGDIITVSREHGLKSGDYVEIFSSNTEFKGMRYVVGTTSNTFSFRDLRWYESAWFAVQRFGKRILGGKWRK
jgi:anaerobic selenocysteine-containing dehydrogenase